MDKVEGFLRYLVITLLSIMVFIVLLQIIYRYLFNNPLGWSEEVTRYLFIYVIFLGAAIGVRKKIHVGVDILTERLQGTPKVILDYFVSTIIILFLMFVAYLGVHLSVSTLNQNSPALGIPIGLAYFAIPIGAFVSIIFVVEDMVVSRREEKL